MINCRRLWRWVPRWLSITLTHLHPMVPIPGRVEWERHAGRLPLDSGQLTVLVAGAGGPGTQLCVDYRPGGRRRPLGRLIAAHLHTTEGQDELRIGCHQPIIGAAAGEGNVKWVDAGWVRAAFSVCAVAGLVDCAALAVILSFAISMTGLPGITGSPLPRAEYRMKTMNRHGKKIINSALGAAVGMVAPAALLSGRHPRRPTTTISSSRPRRARSAAFSTAQPRGRRSPRVRSGTTATRPHRDWPEIKTADRARPGRIWVAIFGSTKGRRPTSRVPTLRSVPVSATGHRSPMARRGRSAQSHVTVSPPG